jgi:hypothetical protein
VNKFINQALENALVQAQYWNDWASLLRKLGYEISETHRHGPDSDVSKALNTIMQFCRDQELNAWQRTMMFGLVQQDEKTRKRIAEMAKDQFLILPNENEHYRMSIGHYLDKNNTAFSHLDKETEEAFRKEIREHFSIKDDDQP